MQSAYDALRCSDEATRGTWADKLKLKACRGLNSDWASLLPQCMLAICSICYVYVCMYVYIMCIIMCIICVKNCQDMNICE